MDEYLQLQLRRGVLPDAPDLGKGQLPGQHHPLCPQGPGQYFPISEEENGTYILNAKDLCLLPHLDKLWRCGPPPPGPPDGPASAPPYPPR